MYEVLGKYADIYVGTLLQTICGKLKLISTNTHLFNFLMAALSVVKSGLSAGSSVQHFFMRFPTSSSQLSSLVFGLRHFWLFFTPSTISEI